MSLSTKGFPRKQPEASAREGRSRPAVRKLIFDALERALLEHYGENYSNRCIQSAAAVVRLLQRCGIDSILVRGEACFGQVLGPRLAWAQFGGEPDRFHFWSMTRFGELIDFTVHQHHLAPGVEPGGVPCPALWWNDAGHMPAAFCYLPGPTRGRIAVNLADPEEQAHFQRFLKGAEEAFEAALGVCRT